MNGTPCPSWHSPSGHHPPGVPHRPPSLHLQLFFLLPGTAAAKVAGWGGGWRQEMGRDVGEEDKTIRNLLEKRPPWVGGSSEMPALFLMRAQTYGFLSPSPGLAPAPITWTGTIASLLVLLLCPTHPTPCSILCGTRRPHEKGGLTMSPLCPKLPRAPTSLPVKATFPARWHTRRSSLQPAAPTLSFLAVS